ncbi:hypothetical protein D1872_341560 [compost metagenome]
MGFTLVIDRQIAGLDGRIDRAATGHPIAPHHLYFAFAVVDLVIQTERLTGALILNARTGVPASV